MNNENEKHPERSGEIAARGKALAAASAKARRERNEAGLSATRSPILKLADNPTSLRAAVDAKCWDCMGAGGDPCVNWSVGNCRTKACALWAVRPHQRLAGRPMPIALRSQLEVVR